MQNLHTVGGCQVCLRTLCLLAPVERKVRTDLWSWSTRQIVVRNFHFLFDRTDVLSLLQKCILMPKLCSGRKVLFSTKMQFSLWKFFMMQKHESFSSHYLNCCTIVLVYFIFSKLVSITSSYRAAIFYDWDSGIFNKFCLLSPECLVVWATGISTMMWIFK